jgi:tRNA(Ile)-lysidine synthase
MALLRLAAEWRAASAATRRLTVLTVDHGLRAAAAGEAVRVGEWARPLGLPHVILRWQGPKPARSLQETARKARYDLMASWCQGGGCAALVTAHTLDDQAETVVMRMARTASLDSLAGIPAVGQWGGLPVVRPLLGLRRAALRNYLVGIGQAWIDDPSNDDPQFERVRIRRTLPDLAAIGLTVEALGNLARLCAEEMVAQERRTTDWLVHHLVEDDAGHCSFAGADFLAQPLAIQVRALGRIVLHYGGRRAVERHELERLALTLAKGKARRTLGGALIGEVRGKILVGREAARIAFAKVPVGPAGEVVWDGRFLVRAPEGSKVVAAGHVLPGPGSRSLVGQLQRARPAVILPGGQVTVLPFPPESAIDARFRPLLVR